MDAQAWDDRYASQELVWGVPPNPVIVQHVWPLTRGRALDLGCGEGRHAIWLALNAWTVTAADFSRVALNKGATIATKLPRRTRERLTWLEADLATWDIPAGFDLIIGAYVHFPAATRGDLMRRCAQALAPGGTLVMLGHDSTNLREGVGGPQDPDVLYTPEDIVADLGDLLTIDVAEKLHRATERGVAIDALVKAHKS